MNMNETGDFQGLVGRVDGLEGRIAELERAWVRTAAADIVPLAAPELKKVPMPQTKPEPAPEPKPLPQPQLHHIPEMAIQLSTVKAAGGEAAPSTTLEERIGLYWLSKLGIGFLVVGVALLIVYSFKNFGPAAKIATGFVMSSLLMVAGEYLEKRNKIPWYARLLEGGAWAMGYFTTYAMYHVESVRLIQDPLTDLILLLGVAGLAVAHAINKRSQAMAVCSITLGFLTLTLSHITTFSSVAAAVLVALTVVLAVRQKWYPLFLYSVLASYASFLANGSLSFSLHSLALPAPYEGAGAAFSKMCMTLAPCLFGFGIVPLLVKVEKKGDENILITGTIINAAVFSAFFFSRAYDFFGTAASIYNLAMAVWFFTLAVLCKRAGSAACARINALFALTIGTFYFSGANIGRVSYVYLALELALLVWAGLTFKLKSFRWFAMALACVVSAGVVEHMCLDDTIRVGGTLLPFGLVAALASIAALSFSAYLQRLKTMAENASVAERKIAFHEYWTLAVFQAWILPLAMISIAFDTLGRMPEVVRTPVLLLSWGLLAASVVTMAIKMQSRYMQVVSIVILALIVIPATLNWNFQWIVSIDATLLLYAAALAHRHYASVFKRSSVIPFRAQFFIAALCTFLLPLGADWRGEQLANFWGAEAVCLLLVGMVLKDRFVRMLAPVVFFIAFLTVFANSFEWSAVVPVVGAFYAAWALYRFSPENDFAPGEVKIRHIYSCVAALILIFLFGHKLERTWISCAWALQGFLTLGAGFLLREKPLRITGLSIFGALVMRLFFVDLAGAETIYRIFAFIVAGLILLISAYAYSLFARKFDLSGKKPASAPGV